MSHLFLMTDFGAATPTDNGTRPYTGSVPFWDNASIFMEGGPSQTSTTVGTPTTVRVRVSNNGTEAVAAVSADVYVMNPFVGPFDPTHALAKLHGFAASIAPGSGTSSPTDAHVLQCQVQDPNLGPVPWTPTATDLSQSTNGHLCLVANAYADGDGAPWGGTTAFDIADDAHLGQRNIALLAAGQKLKLMILPAVDGAPTALDIHQLTAKQALGKGEWWLLRSRSTITKITGRTGLQIAGRRGHPAVPLGFSRKIVRGEIEVDGLEPADLHALSRLAGQLPAAQKGVRAHSLRRVEWGEGRYVLPERDSVVMATVTVQRDDAAGSLQAFDIVQRDRTGRVLGGFRVLSLVG